MINFNKLKVVTSTTYSFVGIKKENGQVYLFLPKGFTNEDAESLSFEDKRNLFFLLYSILQKFRAICIEKNHPKNSSKMLASDRDGLLESDFGSQLDASKSETTIFYSKLDVIENFLDTYDELKVLALKYRLGKSQKFNVSQIHKYLHQAVYLQITLHTLMKL
jgi:hypothetical protein